MAEHVSGVILFDETLRQSSADGTPFPKLLADAGVIPGIKVDAGAKPLALTDGETVSKRRFMEKVADAMDLPHPTRTPPMWFAWTVTWCAEKLAKLRGAKKAPLFNFPRLKFIAYNLDFSIQKAMTELGYRPRVNFEEAIGETMAWYKKNKTPEVHV